MYKMLWLGVFIILQCGTVQMKTSKNFVWSDTYTDISDWLFFLSIVIALPLFFTSIYFFLHLHPMLSHFFSFDCSYYNNIHKPHYFLIIFTFQNLWNSSNQVKSTRARYEIIYRYILALIDGSTCTYYMHIGKICFVSNRNVKPMG